MVELVICVRKCHIITGIYQIFLACSKTKCRTDRYLNSFFVDAISVWNNVFSNFKNLPTFGRLKNHLISLIRPKLRSTFDFPDTIYQRHPFQLRLGLSHLRYHKKRLNFAETPCDNCLCKRGVEDTSHFLISCPFYITQRETLARVHEILRKTTRILSEIRNCICMIIFP